MNNWAYYIRHYAESKARKSLFERYVATSLGCIAKAEKTYDQVINEFNDRLSNKPKRSATDIKKDLIKKFN